MNAADFLEVAKRLEGSVSEAERRTSIGRSYYALYNVLVDFLSSHGVPFDRNAKDHGRLVRCLMDTKHREADAIGAALRDLRNRRNEADYQMSRFVGPRESNHAYRLARTELDRFIALSPEGRHTIVERIKGLA
ncbi:MAG: hypothetical protein HY238_20735 [Acidobacteria bacterium]|nr:hypothetical protein [Acidobacteriota bacterium]